MKKFNKLFFFFLFTTVCVFAQSPEKMSYQAVIRDASNTLVSNQSVGMQISILQTTTTETAVYTETHTVTANINGLISLEIGTGSTSDNFSTIDWSAGPYFIKTETDPTGGNSYTIIGTSQLMSVPFALYAKTSENGITSDQADAIVTNTAKTGITSDQADAIVGNTAKTGITADQAGAIVTNTAKTGITSDQADAIVANTAKTGITSDQSDAIVANTAKTGITSDQSDAIVANTAKTGITSDQADAIVANTTKTGITSDQADAIVTNTAKTGITSDQADAIVANTAKTGITTQQATDITSNNAKTGITTVQSDAIEVNTAKTSMVLGITAETALVGNTVTITTVQSEAIIANTAKVSYIQPTYELNTFYAALGGYVIDINSDGKHGVVLAMKDQGYDNWYNANNLLNNPDNHDTEGAQFRDWRLPSKRELNLMYLSYLNGNPTNLAGATYWSSSEFKFDYAWLHYFFSGQQDDVNKVNPYNIRVVRSF